MRNAMKPFMNIQGRGIAMQDPVPAPFGPFKVPDELTSYKLPMQTGKELPGPMMANSFNGP